MMSDPDASGRVRPVAGTDMRFSRKVAIISPSLPPMLTGQSIMLRRILSGVDPDSYCQVSTANICADVGAQFSPSDLPSLPASMYDLSEMAPGIKGNWGALRPAAEAGQALHIVRRAAAELCDIMQREDCSGAVVCSGGMLDLPAATLAAWWQRIPMFLYLFDWYQQSNATAGGAGGSRAAQAAAVFEHFAVRRAAKIIVPNEFLADCITKAHGVQPTVVRNPVDPRALDELGEASFPHDPPKLVVLYTGAVYEAQFAAVRDMAAAVRRLGPHVEFRLLLTGNPRLLVESGLDKQVDVRPAVSAPQIFVEQRQADILYLPLTHASGYPDVIRTSAPGKMAEYLASGRPVLADVPGDCFVDWYFRSNNCGYVVNNSGVDDIVHTIRSISDDAAARAVKLSNARRCAAADFDLRTIRHTFVKLVNDSLPM